MSPQTLLGIGLGVALGSVAAYLVHLHRRLDALEERTREGGPPGDEDEGPGN